MNVIHSQLQTHLLSLLRDPLVGMQQTILLCQLPPQTLPLGGARRSLQVGREGSNSLLPILLPVCFLLIYCSLEDHPGP